MVRADRRKYHFIYRTTCSVTGKHYTGMHSTDDLDDGYMGSGKRLRYSINKYGKESHSKELIEMLPDRKSLVMREREIVNESTLHDQACLNLRIGGEGAAPGHPTSKETRQKISVAVSGSKNGSWGKPAPNRGKPFSKETKTKMSHSMLGNKNSIREIEMHPMKDEFKIKVGNRSIDMDGLDYSAIWIPWLKGFTSPATEAMIDTWIKKLVISRDRFRQISIDWQNTHRPDWRK